VHSNPLPDPDASHAAHARRRLLIAEDDEDVRFALSALLGEHYELVLEDSVASALRRYAHEPPDLLVVDYGLPDATGVELLEAIRESCGCEPAAILISANSEPRRFCRQAGFLAFVEKPLRTLDLVWAIERSLVAAQSNRAAPVAAAS
jgi:CheY-like chemotaxis protein